MTSQRCSLWTSWQEYYHDQQEIELPKGTAVPHVNVRIRYILCGSPTNGTILLMHGIPTWGYLYHDVIPPLVQAGYQALVPDFLGHGFSDRRDKFDRSFQDQARMVVSLLQALQIPHVHVVGHDTGGAVALILAIEHAHLVDRLVLTNIVCYDRFDDDMLMFGHPMVWKPKSIDDLKNALEQSLEMGLSRKERLTEEFRVGIMAPWLSEEGKLSLIRNAMALNANQTMALVDRHATISAPTLVLWASDDPWQKLQDGRQIAVDIGANAKFMAIENASHWVQQDAPAEFSMAVIEFLES